MRLAQRLLISHSLFTAMLLGSAAFSVVALVRMTTLLTEIRQEQLGAVQEEEAVHQAAWAIEVAARHALLACEGDLSAGPRVAASLRESMHPLESLLARYGDSVQPSIRTTAQHYLSYARHVSEADTCTRLLEPSLRKQRLDWDENLTDAWIALVHSLHEVLLAREAEAYAIGATALGVELVFGCLAVLAAWGVARWMARGVTRPLELLALQARRVGQADFSPIAPLEEGPLEVRELAAELERSRARLAEFDQLKDAFVASVSHDLRTPLTRLRSALGLIADGTTGPLNEQQRRVVELARSACEREIRLVSALLDMSRVKSGKALRREAGCSLDVVLHQAMEDMRGEAELAGVQLELEAEGTMAPASLDAVLIERAVANLLGNAIRASSRGQRVRMVRTVTQEGPPGHAASGTWARVVVRDEGPGVRPEVRDRLFEHFFTSPMGNNTASPGMGLGLPLAREMMRAHGGEVLFLDEPGPGAAFALWVPLERPTPPSAASEAPASAASSGRSPA
jgi:two-component system sensor histidine kinase GlrK